MKYIENRVLNFYIDGPTTKFYIGGEEFWVNDEAYDTPLTSISSVSVNTDANAKKYLEIIGTDDDGKMLVVGVCIDNSTPIEAVGVDATSSSDGGTPELAESAPDSSQEAAFSGN